MEGMDCMTKARKHFRAFVREFIAGVLDSRRNFCVYSKNCLTIQLISGMLTMTGKEMIAYPAKIDREDNSYIVEFPDLPGCLTCGDTLEEAKENAREALSGYLESIDLRKIKIPRPSFNKEKNVHYIKPERRVAFAVWLKLKRAEKNLTQKKVAELLQVNFQAYQKYENPKTANPTLKTIEKIERVFNETIIKI